MRPRRHPFDQPGLSPQVRGTVITMTQEGHMTRFIPAGAGNRRMPGSRIGVLTVYPRRCGEQVQGVAGYSTQDGLSPQVRGTALRGSSTGSRGRFIPAGAGNSVSLDSERQSHPVYPRRCGEQSDTYARFGISGGLSPQVRGTGQSGNPTCREFRFIPAGAGNRPRWRGLAR